MSHSASLSPASPSLSQRSVYTGSGRRSPTSLAVVIALHAGVAAVVLLGPGEKIVEWVDPPIEITNIRADPPPPSPQPVPDEKMARTPLPQPLPVDPVIDLAQADPYVLPNLPPIGPVIPGTGAGSDIRPIDPPHVPTLVEPVPDPRFAGRFQPTYPAAMLRLQTEGVVTVRVRIGADGRVVDVEKLSATNDAFWERTREQALGQWRFKPATRDGVPVEATKTLTVRFKIT